MQCVTEIIYILNIQYNLLSFGHSHLFLMFSRKSLVWQLGLNNKHLFSKLRFTLVLNKRDAVYVKPNSSEQKCYESDHFSLHQALPLKLIVVITISYFIILGFDFFSQLVRLDLPPYFIVTNVITGSMTPEIMHKISML